RADRLGLRRVEGELALARAHDHELDSVADRLLGDGADDGANRLEGVRRDDVRELALHRGEPSQELGSRPGEAAVTPVAGRWTESPGTPSSSRKNGCTSIARTKTEPLRRVVEARAAGRRFRVLGWDEIPPLCSDDLTDVDAGPGAARGGAQAAGIGDRAAVVAGRDSNG